MLPSDQYKGWKYKTQKQPRYRILKRDMLSTFRIDMPATVLFNVASMYNTMGSDTFVAFLKNLPEPDQRWIVVFEPFVSY
jgi:hypothetical protein